MCYHPKEKSKTNDCAQRETESRASLLAVEMQITGFGGISRGGGGGGGGTDLSRD